MKDIADGELLKRVDELRKKERMTLSVLLDHLREVHRRRLYCDLGFGSLYKYLVKHLGYSEGGASRRIKALKLTNANPKAQKMIEAGELNLTTACLAQNFIEAGNSQNILSKLKNKTVDETKRELSSMGHSSNAKPKELKRYIDRDNVRVAWNLKKETFDKLCDLKDRFKINDIDELLNKLVDDFSLQKKKTRKSKGSRNSRTIPAKTKRDLLTRAEYVCEFPRCDEKRFLEIDHIVPVALGGNNESANLRVLCKSHNQRAAVAQLGLNAMDRHLN